MRGTVFVGSGAVIPGLSHKCDMTLFVKGGPSGGAQGAECCTVPSSRVTRECRYPAEVPPPFTMSD